MNIDEQVSYLKKGTVDLIREEDLKAKLERSAKTGKPILVPPAGYVAVIYSRTDNTRGVFKAPAGIEAVVASAVAQEQSSFGVLTISE